MNFICSAIKGNFALIAVGTALAAIHPLVPIGAGAVYLIFRD